jgi:voltage-gated potassium channel
MTAARWNTIWEWPLTGAAVAFLAIYTWQVLSDHQGTSEALGVILTVTWAMFAVDYAGRLYLARSRRSWFLRHLLDLAIVVLPILRPLRLVRLVILLA